MRGVLRLNPQRLLISSGYRIRPARRWWMAGDEGSQAQQRKREHQRGHGFQLQATNPLLLDRPRR